MGFWLRWLLARICFLPAAPMLQRFGVCARFYVGERCSDQTPRLRCRCSSSGPYGTGKEGSDRGASGPCRTSQEQTGNAGLFGDPWMHTVLCINTTKSKFYDVDLTAAVEKEGHHLRGQKARRPSYIQPHAFAKGFSLIEGFYHGQRCRWKIISPHLPTFRRNISKDRVR